MTVRTELLKEIDRLPPKYFGELFDFVNFLLQKAKVETGNDAVEYQAMAADIERETEACEWCNSYFGPSHNK